MSKTYRKRKRMPQLPQQYFQPKCKPPQQGEIFPRSYSEHEMDFPSDNKMDQNKKLD